eukprot:7128831-Pyramimonas_sp.AAC.2
MEVANSEAIVGLEELEAHDIPQDPRFGEDRIAALVQARSEVESTAAMGSDTEAEGETPTPVYDTDEAEFSFQRENLDPPTQELNSAFD